MSIHIDQRERPARPKEEIDLRSGDCLLPHLDDSVRAMLRRAYQKAVGFLDNFTGRKGISPEQKFFDAMLG